MSDKDDDTIDFDGEIDLHELLGEPEPGPTRPTATIHGLPNVRMSHAAALERARQQIPADADACMVLWLLKSGQVGYVTNGTNGHLLWLAQTMAITIPLGIDDQPEEDE